MNFNNHIRLQHLDDTTGLPAALANIIDTTHTFELKSNAYYEHATFESFTCWNIISPDANMESGGSSTSGATSDAPRSSRKKLCKHPFVATPMKVYEQGTSKRFGLKRTPTDIHLKSLLSHI